MSDSEEEFASADEGETSTRNTTNKVSDQESQPPVKPSKEPPQTTSKTEQTKSSAQTSKKSQSISSKNVPPSSSAKSEVKQGSKSKAKNSKQKRKQANKKEALEDVKNKEVGVGNQEECVEKQANLKTDTNIVTAASSDAGTSSELSTETTDHTDNPQVVTEPSVKDSEQDKVSKENEQLSQKEDSEKKEPVSEKSEEDVHDQTMDRGDSILQDADSPSTTDSVSGNDSEIKQNTGQAESSSGWGGWSSWGSSFVNVATASVSTFTSQVGEGFSTVLETVESSLGAPPPEELAKVTNETGDRDDELAEKSESPDTQSKGDNQELPENITEDPDGKDKKDETTPKTSDGGGWLSSWGVSNLTHLVSDTGKTLVTGSLDVLETIGKKTYDALSEHDPGLKAAMKGDNKPNLSSLLREAKDQAAERVKLEAEFEESRQAHFGAMFDEYQGLAHLEALEMLSNQSETKVQALLTSVSPDTREPLKEKLLEIKAIFELEELEDADDEIDQDFPKLISENLSEFHSGTSPAKLNSVQAKVHGWLTNFSKEEKETCDPKEIHKVSIQSLAELTAKTVEQYHKAGELLLLQREQNREMVARAKSLASVTRVVCTEVGIISSKFTRCLNQVAENLEDSESINTFITNVYLEASNSSTYIQDAFQLLLPVVQQAVIQESQGDG